jgi:hypothetical protein
MDAKHMLFLLELFEGKLSINDIMLMELPLLLNLEKEKADQIEKEAKRLSAMNRARTDSGKKGGTIVNNGKRR